MPSSTRAPTPSAATRSTGATARTRSSPATDLPASREVVHTYADGPASRTITVDLTDEDDTFLAAGTKTITVNNVAPTISLTGAPAVNEGSAYSSPLGPSSTRAPTPSAPTQITLGRRHEHGHRCRRPAGLPRRSSTPTPTARPRRTITVDLTDEDGRSCAAGTKTITVTNVAPTATFNAPASVSEGSNIDLSLTAVVDPARPTPTSSASAATTASPGPPWSSTNTFACSTDDNGTRDVKGEVRDDDGGSNTYSAAVTVTNVAPTVTLLGSATADEGDTNSYTYSWTDPGTADTFPAAGNSISCGINGTASDVEFDALAQTGSFKCTWSDDSGLAPRPSRPRSPTTTAGPTPTPSGSTSTT